MDASPWSRSVTLSGLSLRTRLLLLAVALAVPAGAFQGYLAWGAYADARQEGQADALHAAQEAAVAVQTFLTLAQNVTEGLAAEGAEVLMDPATCANRVGVTLDMLAFYAGVSVVDRRGDIVCSALELPPGDAPSAADRAWFRRVIALGQFTISEPVRGRVTQRDVLVLAAPIRDARGRIVGAVSGGLELVQLASLVARGVRDAETVITVTDSSGMVLTRSADLEEWVGRMLPPDEDPVLRSGPGYRVIGGADFEGRMRTFGRVDLMEPPWRVYAGIPDDVLYRDSFALARLEAIAGLGLLILALGLATLAYGGISRSLTDLTTEVARASDGKPVRSTEATPREFALVAEQLNRTLEARARAEERHRAFLLGAPFGVYVSTLDGTLIEVNRAFAEMLGFDDSSELEGRNLSEIYADPGVRARLVEGHGYQETFRGVEVDWVRRDGGRLRVRLSGRSITGSNSRELFEGIAEDVTAQRELEEVTRHQQRVEVISRLASGVAHDLNNVLTVIGANAEILGTEMEPDHPLRDEVDDIGFASQSAAALTRNLLAFSRRRVEHPEPTHVGEVLDGLGAFVRRVLPESVELQVEVAAPLPPVWVDRGNLEQCILNLLVNSRDALPHGGHIRVAVSERTGDGEPERWVVIAVSDDGAGMEPEVVPQVFDAFFTTKPEGRGTGLGLTTVESIVTDAGGRVHLESVLGHGTRVELWFPAWPGEGA